ncbi:MAG: (2Fe-2S)-binding protein [Gemmatimonadota bacterium]
MEIVVNGSTADLSPALGESLAETLRDRLTLRGTKVACDRGECGACTVLLDGNPVYSCLVLTVAAAGRQVTTIEGIGATAPGGEPHEVQRAFVECDAVQCGFCTPGQVLSAVALLDRDPEPDEDAIVEAMSGNLCRCGTYPAIRRAILLAAARLAAAREGGR